MVTQITEDFLKHISSKQDKGSTSENIKRGSSEGIDSLPYAQSAEQLVSTGVPILTSQWQCNYWYS